MRLAEPGFRVAEPAVLSRSGARSRSCCAVAGLLVTWAGLPGMREQGWGRVVNIASLVALGAPERSAYGAAKAALISVTRAWALELATTGITVNAVTPGPTETELFRETTGPVLTMRCLALQWFPCCASVEPARSRQRLRSCCPTVHRSSRVRPCSSTAARQSDDR